MAARAIARRTASTAIPAINPVFEPLDVACGVCVAELLDAVSEVDDEVLDVDEEEVRNELG